MMGNKNYWSVDLKKIYILLNTLHKNKQEKNKINDIQNIAGSSFKASKTGPFFWWKWEIKKKGGKEPLMTAQHK